MPKYIRPTVQQVTQALRASNGNVTGAARLLGVDRITVTCRINSDERIAAELERIREAPLDIAEGNVFKGLDEGDPEYTRWFLNKRGQSRGYGTTKRVEITRAEFPFTSIERIPVLPTIEPSPQDRTLMLAAESKTPPVGSTPIEPPPPPLIVESAPVDPAPKPIPVVGYAERLKRAL